MPFSTKGEKHDWTAYVWLIYLSFFLVGPALKEHATALDWIVTAAGAVIFLALYMRGWGVRGRDAVWVIVAITVLGLVYFPFNPGAGTFFIYAAGFAGRIGSGRSPVLAILTIELVVSIEILLVHVPWYNAFWPLVFTPIIGAVNAHYEGIHRSNRRLRLAQEEIERLAKLAERERIARDLHDLLGHTLSLIVLKSELASKLAGHDPRRAGEEIGDVERISRVALNEVRQAVRGYRSGNLQSEIEAMKEMLQAAAIECATDIDSLSLAPSHEAILSMALREAVTNVVRHSRAKHCTIRLTRADRDLRLTVADDGVGGSDAEGFGLTGMRERIAAHGGTLTRDGSRGTLLTISLPLDRAMERSA